MAKVPLRSTSREKIVAAAAASGIRDFLLASGEKASVEGFSHRESGIGTAFR
jgi:hypothetical protein